MTNTMHLEMRVYRVQGDIHFSLSFFRIEFMVETIPVDCFVQNWVSDNEYEMKSTQYNTKDEPTGFFYGGRFIGIKK